MSLGLIGKPAGVRLYVTGRNHALLEKRRVERARAEVNRTKRAAEERERRRGNAATAAKNEDAKGVGIVAKARNLASRVFRSNKKG